MYKLAKTCIFLRWPAYNCKWPDGIFTGVYFVDFHNREIMRKAVISQMITKWSFGFILVGIHLTSNYKISIGTYTKIIFINIPEPSSAQNTRKSHFTDAFGQGHYCGYAMRWRPSNKHTYFKWQTFLICFILMYTNAPMQLVMQANFFI